MMRTLCNRGCGSPLNLRSCHSFNALSSQLVHPFLLLLLPPPTQFQLPSIRTSIIRQPNSRGPSSCFSSGSVTRASMAASGAEMETKPFSVLFVCLGNICRSPAAEGVFTDFVKKRGLDSHFKIDSAGTINYHEGNQADPRMRAASKSRGIEITSISRPIQPSDFRDFDLIVAMDEQNRQDILEAYNRWKLREPLPEDAHKKVKLMCSYCKTHEETEVPDPFYGGQQGFEKVWIYLRMLVDHCLTAYWRRRKLTVEILFDPASGFDLMNKLFLHTAYLLVT